MATKKKQVRAAGASRGTKKPVEVATPSLVESGPVETLVQVLSEEEIGKSKTLVFEALKSMASKNHAQEALFSKLGVVVDQVGQLIANNFTALTYLVQHHIKKAADNLRSRHFSELAAEERKAASQKPQQPAQTQHPKHHHKPAGQHGQKPLTAAQKPLTQSLEDKLRAAGHSPVEQPPIPEQKPETQAQQ